MIFPPKKILRFKVLMNEFARHNWHLYTGIFSTKMVFDVLRENNMNDIAYTLANQRGLSGLGIYGGKWRHHTCGNHGNVRTVGRQ